MSSISVNVYHDPDTQYFSVYADGIGQWALHGEGETHAFDEVTQSSRPASPDETEALYDKLDHVAHLLQSLIADRLMTRQEAELRAVEAQAAGYAERHGLQEAA